jgi:hypothetical protein
MESMRRLWWYPFGATAGRAGRNVRGGIRPRKRGTAVFESLDEIIGGHFPMWPDAPDERFRKTDRFKLCGPHPDSPGNRGPSFKCFDRAGISRVRQLGTSKSGIKRAGRRLPCRRWDYCFFRQPLVPPAMLEDLDRLRLTTIQITKSTPSAKKAVVEQKRNE